MAEIKAHLEKWRPMKAIRAKCLECSCGSPDEVRNCQVKTCPLWEYRFGTKKKSKFAGIATQGDFEDSEIEDEDFIEEEV